MSTSSTALSPTVSRFPKRNRAPISYADSELDDDHSISWADDADFVLPPAKKSRKSKQPAKPRSEDRVFHFMHLPPELRDEIYQAALVDPKDVYFVRVRRLKRLEVERVAKLTFDYVFRNVNARGRYRHRRFPLQAEYIKRTQQIVDGPQSLVPSLLAVSKQIKRESEEWLYRHNKFIVEDMTALHTFLTDLTAPTRGLIRQIMTGRWGYDGMAKAMNHSALTLLADGGVNLNTFRIFSCVFGWRFSVPHPGIEAAGQFYKESFNWLEAMTRARGVDSAVRVIEIPQDYITNDPRYATETARFRDELKRLILAGTTSASAKLRKKRERREKQRKKLERQNQNAA
ncbi:MAG: hypothetical protein M1822_005022 [Bathelium mastoideum]|nr:MAG: hypothetical protein M1822_005022 [Bathelium mastoideum]